MENIVKNVSAKFFKIDENEIIVIKRLLGGRSNLMYLFKIKDSTQLYTFRIPGKNSHVFVDRQVEIKNLELIESLDINSKLVCFDTENGYKISKYINGDCLSDLNVDSYLEEVASLLLSYHNSKITTSNDYNPFERLSNYENLMPSLGYNEDRTRYLKIKNKFLNFKDFLENDILTFCHGDTQTDNIILGDNKKMYLLDWEFAGNNYRFYDIACFGDKDFTYALKLLEKYLKRKPENIEYKRLYLWRCFQCLQWHNVALYKHLIGLSEDLKVDFKMFSDLYTEKAENYFNEALKYHN